MHHNWKRAAKYFSPFAERLWTQQNKRQFAFARAAQKICPVISLNDHARRTQDAPTVWSIASIGKRSPRSAVGAATSDRKSAIDFVATHPLRPRRIKPLRQNCRLAPKGDREKRSARDVDGGGGVGGSKDGNRGAISQNDASLPPPRPSEMQSLSRGAQMAFRAGETRPPSENGPGQISAAGHCQARLNARFTQPARRLPAPGHKESDRAGGRATERHRGGASSSAHTRWKRKRDRRERDPKWPKKTTS